MAVGHIVARKYFSCHFSAIVEAGLYMLSQNMSRYEFSPPPKQTSHTQVFLLQRAEKLADYIRKGLQ